MTLSVIKANRILEFTNYWRRWFWLGRIIKPIYRRSRQDNH